MRVEAKPVDRNKGRDKLSGQLQRETQDEVKKWLQATRGERDSDVALEYTQRAANLSPDDPQVQEHLQSVLFRKLSRDAFIAFVAETDRHYVVTFRNSRPVVVPKARQERDLFPRSERTEAERAMGMIRWMVMGLIPAGLGALILAPFVVGRGLDVFLHGRLDPREYKLAAMAILLALLIGSLGMIFALLLMLRVVG